MSEAEDYRANLEVCRRMAEKAPNELEKRAWLDMAKSWKILFITRQQSSTDQDFDPPSSGNRAIRITSLCLWPMRQAGGYLLEYRAIREKAASFTRSLHWPEWITSARRLGEPRRDVGTGPPFSK